MDPTASKTQRRVLLADTDQAQLVVLKDGLKNRGFDVRTSIDGSKALENALTQNPDVIVLGLELPVIRTKQLMDILSVNPKTKSIPILLMATKAAQLKKLGIEPTDHMVKPVHVEALLDRIYRLYKKMDQVREVSGEAKEIQGNLSQIPIGDLLQILNINRKSGAIQLERSGANGVIYLQDGQVINATLGKLEGEKAFFRMLAWEEGRFDYTPGKAISPVRIKFSIENLLMEGMRQIDELRKIEEKLPPPTAHLALAIDPGALPKGLRPITQELFLLMEFYSSLQELVDNCLYPDYEVIQTLYTLLSKGLIKVADKKRSAAQKSLLNFDQVHQLHKELSGFRAERLGKAYGKILLLARDPETALLFLNRGRAIEGFRILPESRHADGRHVRLGPLAVLALGELVEAHFFVLPIDRTALPIWHAFKYDALGRFFIFGSGATSELAQLNRAHQFFAGQPGYSAYFDVSTGQEGASAVDEKKVRKLFHLEESATLHRLGGNDSSDDRIPDILKTLFMSVVNKG